MTKRTQIIISFPIQVEITDDVCKGLVDIIQDYVCEPYKNNNPDRTMWVFGVGDMMTVNPLMLSDHEPIPFDSNVLHIECAERENYNYKKES